MVIIHIMHLVFIYTTNNERIEQGYCLYIWDNLCDTIYHFISANKVLLNKNIIHHEYKYLLNQPEPWQFIFFQETWEIFHKNSRTIHLYCFSQYQKYLCKKYSRFKHIQLNRLNVILFFAAIIQSQQSINFVYYPQKITWSSAREVCQSIGGDLATIDSEEIKDYIAWRAYENYGTNIL